ncbi:MAG: NAD+ synthase [Hydrotalea sp.]|nr:NAD+ synthase [Hydrotalea sp.]
MSDISITVVPFHPKLGDNHGNAEKIIAILRAEKQQKTDLVIFPELAITGYYVRDLYQQQNFLAAQDDALQQIMKTSAAENLPAFIIGVARGVAQGLAMQPADNNLHRGLKNSLLFIDQGRVIGQHDKYNLPNYDVFDEGRYFTPANQEDKNFATPIKWRGMTLGVMICEELWQGDMPPLIAEHKPDMMVVINASPFERGKPARRVALTAGAAKKYQTPVIYNNMYGGFDEIILDGHNIVADSNGDIIANQLFLTDMVRLQWRGGKITAQENTPQVIKENTIETMAQYFAAIKIGLSDYMANNGFTKIVVGVSGGIDSALTLALAAAVIGRENVLAYFLPTGYSSDSSRDDAQTLCDNFGVDLETIAIEPLYRLFLSTLKINEKNGAAVGVTAQNIQSRIRGVILMARANETGGLLLATGNKSELAVGYSTLYGDSCGGYNLLKDLYKKDVYDLARWLNQQHKPQIPTSIIDKAPTAELSPGQKDSDSLPQYDILDAALEKIIEGFGAGNIDNNIEKMLRRNEFKRNQSPPGPKLTTRAFGNGWRLPLGYRPRNNGEDRK